MTGENDEKPPVAETSGESYLVINDNAKVAFGYVINAYISADAW